LKISKEEANEIEKVFNYLKLKISDFTSKQTVIDQITTDKQDVSPVFFLQLL
jgi:hypothetical protein